MSYLQLKVTTPAPTPGSAYKQPKTVTYGPTPPDPDDDCPLCHDLQIWPSKWREKGWRPPRTQMCDVHVGQWDFIEAVEEWNGLVSSCAERDRQAQAAQDSQWAKQPGRDELGVGLF